MLPSLTTVSPLTGLSTFGFTVEGASSLINSEKIKNVAISCFKSCTSLYLCGFGAFELGMNFFEGKISGKENAIHHKVAETSSTYFNLHGSLMASSGVFSLMDALHGFGVVNLGNFADAVRIAGSVLFLCANVVSLEENVRLLIELKNTDWSKTNINEKELNWMWHSAFWGMLSNAGYIIATAALLYGGATAIAILIAALSCVAGGIKILYDLTAWIKANNLF